MGASSVSDYQSVHNCMDIENQIPPSLPLPSGSETALGRRQKGGIPPLWYPFPVLDRKRGVRGDFHNNMSFQLWTP